MKKNKKKLRVNFKNSIKGRSGTSVKIKKNVKQKVKRNIKQRKVKKNIKQRKVKRNIKQRKVKKNIKQRKVKRNIKQRKVKKNIKQRKVKRNIKQRKVKRNILYKILSLKNIKYKFVKKFNIKNIKYKFVKKFNIKNLKLKLLQPIVETYQNYSEKIKNKKLKKIEELRANRLIQIEKERKEKEKSLKIAESLRIQLKQKELKQAIKTARDRDKDIKNFLRKEQAQIRKEQAARQRKFLEELRIEKQIEKFQVREIKELENLEKISLKEKRDDYAGLQARIEKLKNKYRAIRDEKIRERVEALGVQIQDGDDREALLKKEKEYRIERHKIENCLESFYRSSVSLCFQINKRYIPKHRSILRCIDRRFENGEIFIKWDDSPEEEWLLLIYIKNNSPNDGVIIEDKTNLEKNISYEFKTNEIFKASDLMVDSLTQLLERERNKKQASK